MMGVNVVCVNVGNIKRKQEKKHLKKQPLLKEDILECQTAALDIRVVFNNNKKTLGQHIKKYFPK